MFNKFIIGYYKLFVVIRVFPHTHNGIIIMMKSMYSLFYSKLKSLMLPSAY
jgi:hypothetical protein